MEQAHAADFIRNTLRLKTFPLAVKFLKDPAGFPEKIQRPSVTLGKRITICQAVTMARVYGWTLGLTRDDLICVPAMIAFGFTRAQDQPKTLGKLFCQVGFAWTEPGAQTETASMAFLESGEFPAILIAPLAKAPFQADTVAFYGNAAQVMRMIQAWTYHEGLRVAGNFGGKVECTEYLVAPFKQGKPMVAIPGMGDRIFSMTQDDELVFAAPGKALDSLVQGLEEAGKKIGARYPITVYQNFQPEFPKPYKDLAKELKAFDS